MSMSGTSCGFSSKLGILRFTSVKSCKWSVLGSILDWLDCPTTSKSSQLSLAIELLYLDEVHRSRLLGSLACWLASGVNDDNRDMVTMEFSHIRDPVPLLGILTSHITEDMTLRLRLQGIGEVALSVSYTHLRAHETDS